jgi:3-dehydroquinate dehydratase/shikimate dehydrogenase
MNSSQKPRVCISLCEPTLAAIERVAKTVWADDLIEVRLDCLDLTELQTAAASITKLLQEISCEVILTLRPPAEGGRHQLTDDQRREFWSSAIFSNSLFDVELDLAEKFNSEAASSSLPIDWRRTICSYHDFTTVPAQLDHIYERLAATPARVLKIAVQAQDATDCLPMFHLLERARAEGRELIAIAMGAAGVATRILGPSRGAYLTYASVDEKNATAPGQISSKELRSIYRVENITRHSEIFGLMGMPVSHSLSPRMHNAAFAAAGKDAVYIPFEVGDAGAFITRMVHPRTRELDWNLRGLSITAPHKAIVMDHLDWIDDAATQIGAVNTVVVENDQLHGYNTDACGFLAPLEKKLGNLRDARCAIIGAGGAASAALWAIRKAHGTATVFARDTLNATAIEQRFSAQCMKLEGARFRDFDVVVNATPLGTVGEFENETPASASQLRGARLVYDLVYNPVETRFLREAREAGCDVLNGLAMLVAQASEQFKLWTEAYPPENVMHEAAQPAFVKRGSLENG